MYLLRRADWKSFILTKSVLDILNYFLSIFFVFLFFAVFLIFFRDERFLWLGFSQLHFLTSGIFSFFISVGMNLFWMIILNFIIIFLYNYIFGKIYPFKFDLEKVKINNNFMYHVKKIDLKSFVLFFVCLILLIFLIVDLIVFLLMLFQGEFNNVDVEELMIFGLLPVIGVGISAIVSSVLVLIYNYLGKVGHGLKIDIELMGEKENK